MKAILYACAGLVFLTVFACEKKTNTAESYKTAEAQISQDSLMAYQKVLAGKWKNDEAAMKAEATKFRESLKAVAKARNPEKFSPEFIIALDSLISRTERKWNNFRVEFFFDTNKEFKARVRGNDGSELVFLVSYDTKNEGDIHLGVQRPGEKYRTTVKELENPTLTQNHFIWHDRVPVPGADSMLTITHRCIRDI